MKVPFVTSSLRNTANEKKTRNILFGFTANEKQKQKNEYSFLSDVFYLS